MFLNEVILLKPGDRVILKQLKYTTVPKDNDAIKSLLNKELLVVKVDPNYWINHTVEVYDPESLKCFWVSHKDLQLVNSENESKDESDGSD